MGPPEVELLDSLTGAYSRASMKTRLQEEVDRSDRYDQPFSILLLDLDHFKSVNDAFGHRRGDDILIAFAGRLQENARRSDVVFRYGGDEFIILLPSTDTKEAVYLAERLFEHLTENPYEGDPSLKLTLSMGIASFPEDASTPEALFDVADKRHYQAKRQGRNRIVNRDVEYPSGPGFDLTLRLIGREVALEKVHLFFENLIRIKQGSLFVGGSRGIGKTRFLEEVAKIARLHGYLVLQLTGKHSRKSRALGALLEAERGWEQLVSISNGENAFIRSLNQLLADKGNIGVVFTIDNLTDTDRQSLATVERIFYNPSLPVVAIAYSDGLDSALPYFTESPLSESVRLSAFDEESILVWLRHVLRFEPPADFVRWLHAETDGLPDRLHRCLPILTREGYLKMDGGWQFQETSGGANYQNYPLALSLDREQEVARGNLPRELGTFIGRTAELNRLMEWLRETNVVTLTGPEGIGKSRLALQAAVELEDEYPDGAYVYKTALREQEDPEEGRYQLVSNLTGVLGIPLSGKEMVEAQLQKPIAGKKMLFLMDGLENHRNTRWLIEAVLAAAPETRFLLSATEPAGLPGERVCELSGLSVPDEADSPAARHSEAVKLFMTHALRADPEFMLTGGNLVFVIKICRLVGGMPLGIELAAAWVSMFSPEELAAQIEYNYLLSSDRSGEILATRNIQAVFDYFWDLLSGTEQAVLARLTVFQHEFSTVAARQVADASPFFLGGLTNRVFLSRTPSGFFQMHDLIRQYAAAKLAADPEAAAAARLAHCIYYLEFLQSCTMPLRGKRQKETQQEISAAFPNIQSAWEWALQNRQYRLVRDAVDALFLYFVNRGSSREAAAMFDHTAELLEGSVPEAARSEPEFAPAYARIKLRRAVFRSTVGHIREARETITACLEEALAEEDPEEVALCYEHLGWVNYELGLPRHEIVATWEKSLAIYRAREAPWGVSRLLYNLSFISPLEQSQALIKEKLEISTEIGDLVGLADTLLTLGEIQDKLGESEQAFDYLTRSREIFEQLGNQDGIAFTHFGRGDVFISQGLFGTALGVFETANHLFRQTGNLNGLSTSLARICRAAIALGDFERAHQSLIESVELEQEAGSRIGAAYSLNLQGELAMVEGNLPEARTRLEESYRIIRQAEDDWGLGRGLGNLARLGILEGDFKEARARAEEGLAVSERMGETLFIHANQLAAGHAYLGLGETEKAGERFHAGLELADGRRSPPLVLEALLAFARLYIHVNLLCKADPLLRMIQSNPAAPFPVRRDADALLTQTEENTASLAPPPDLNTMVRLALDWRDDG
ncbi:MAG TPA: diguanylate cyclase [Anaerolineales bacterium]|nr:diguanylate cyclase [Anaerolineales bacterium]